MATVLPLPHKAVHELRTKQIQSVFKYPKNKYDFWSRGEHLSAILWLRFILKKKLQTCC